MAVCYIFSGGQFSPDDVAAFSLPKADFIIAADAGLKSLRKIGLEADLLVGDFDTLENPADCGFNGEIRSYPPEKDDTDTMLAARIAAEKGFDEIYIFGALGGRLDHSFANIQTLNFIAAENKKGYIITASDFVTILNPGRHLLKRRERYTLSLFSLGEKVSGLCLDGTKYTLDNAKISFDFPIGVSNEFCEPYASISFTKGRLLVICSKNDKQ